MPYFWLKRCHWAERKITKSKKKSLKTKITKTLKKIAR